MRMWKVLDHQRRSMHGGTYQWEVGEWTPRVLVEPCRSGDHLCHDDHLLHWLGPAIWQVEVHPDAKVVCLDDKVVTSGPVRIVHQTPWDDCAARLFAVECVVEALTLAEVTDDRCWEACAVAQRYALGDATRAELDAAYVAVRTAPLEAWGVARDAAWAAVNVAAGMETLTAVVWKEEWIAAQSAALDVTQVAVRKAVRKAVRSRQTANLLSWLGVTDVNGG